MIKRLYDFIEEYVPIAVFLIICVVMLFQVFMRSIFGISFAWSVEVSQYLNVWISFIGIGFLRKMNAHIKIEMFFDFINVRVGKKTQVALFVVKKILNVVFMVMLIWFGLQLAIRSWNFRSPGLQIRQTWLYVCVPLGAAGYLFREIQSIYHVIIKHEGGAQ